MNSPPYTPIPVTEAEYLAFEQTTDLRHEFIEGDVLPRFVEREAHVLINGSLYVALRHRLKHRDCRVFMSQLRLKVEATGMFAYPDLCVVCGKEQFVKGIFHTLTNPTVIVEILSKSTEAFDRGVKFRNYRQLPSLQEYVLISQDSPRIERFLRRDDGQWIFTDVTGLDATITLPSIDCELALAEVYEQVTFEDSADDSQSSQ